MAENRSTISSRELEDAALDAELASEREEKRKSRSRIVRTILGGICGTLVMGILFVAVALLFIRIPSILFAGTAPLIWLFVWLFRGDTGRPMRIVAAVGTALALVFGSCLHSAGLFMVYGNLPLQYFPYVTSVILSTNYFWGTAFDGAFFALLFSILGFLVTWQFTGDPFPWWKGGSGKVRAGGKKTRNG